MSDVTIWSDFERVNETHFWSMTRNIFIEMKIDAGMGRRNGLGKLIGISHGLVILVSFCSTI